MLPVWTVQYVFVLEHISPRDVRWQKMCRCVCTTSWRAWRINAAEPRMRTSCSDKRSSRWRSPNRHCTTSWRGPKRWEDNNGDAFCYVVGHGKTLAATLVETKQQKHSDIQRNNIILSICLGPVNDDTVREYWLWVVVVIRKAVKMTTVVDVIMENAVGGWISSPPGDARQCCGLLTTWNLS